MNILNDIIDWVENKPAFWQKAIDKLIRNNELTEFDISELAEICKNEIGLSQYEFEFESVDFENLRDYASNTSSSEHLKIGKIFNVENISALSRSSELEFASTGLTVVYGDNGAGKSSYVSILKHTCNTRGHKPKIVNNLYEAGSSAIAKKADIEYTVDGVSFSTVNLVNEAVSNNALKKVDVFDTYSANHYIEGEDEIAFIPQGLFVVEKLAEALKNVETHLNSELCKPVLDKFDYELLEIPVGTSAKSFLENLNSETTLTELRSLSAFNLEKNARIEFLTGEIERLKATDPKVSIKVNEEKIKRFEILRNKLQMLEDSLTGQSLIKLGEVLNTFVSTNEALRDSSNKAFSDLPIEGVGNNSWKMLWESARKFYNESTNSENFPDVDGESNCPLCLQDLGETAKARFLTFEEFVKNDIQKSFDKASEEYSLIVESLNQLNFNFDDQLPTVLEISEHIDGFSSLHDQHLQNLDKQKEYIITLFSAKNKIDSIESIDADKTPKTLISDLITNLKATNVSLETQSIEEHLKPHVDEINELHGEKKLYDFKPKLAREIFRQKRIKLLNQCIGKCGTRAVTTLSNELSSNYVTQNLKQNFKAELQKLGFGNIKIETETKGQRGKQYHYLRLDEENGNGVTLKDILSEGEHRCISLATFLSELSISDHKSAIIFDDPVSSLDHKWRNKIAKRIVEESLDRQVIVFTHDITFLLLIQEHVEKIGCALEIKSLTRKKTETGLIASNPPWDALPVGKRIGILKSEHQKLEKIERTETEEIYKDRAKLLYGKLRETWERFIEEVFLNGVVQRFGRAIQTQRLSKITDLTPEDYKVVDDNMSKCSTYFLGHDTAGALIEEMPDSAEFLSDITVLEDYLKEFRKRR